jgi:hypothetical protein
MTTATKKAPAKATPSSDNATIERLERSLDAAQDAVIALRKDIGAGGQDLRKTVEKTIASARKDTAKLSKALRSDVADLQKAIADPPPRKQPQRKTAARKKTASKSN